MLLACDDLVELFTMIHVHNLVNLHIYSDGVITFIVYNQSIVMYLISFLLCFLDSTYSIQESHHIVFLDELTWDLSDDRVPG